MSGSFPFPREQEDLQDSFELGVAILQSVTRFLWADQVFENRYEFNQFLFTLFTDAEIYAFMTSHNKISLYSYASVC